MQPDLLITAQEFLDSIVTRPRRVALRRVESTVYYAIFHCFAQNCADMLVGRSRAARNSEAWHRVYRALMHGIVKKRCSDQEVISRFPPAIQVIASLFVVQQEKRHRVDYDPDSRFWKTEVQLDITTADKAIQSFLLVSDEQRRAFAVHLLFPKRS